MRLGGCERDLQKCIRKIYQECLPQRNREYGRRALNLFSNLNDVYSPKKSSDNFSFKARISHDDGNVDDIWINSLDTISTTMGNIGKAYKRVEDEPIAGLVDGKLYGLDWNIPTTFNNLEIISLSSKRKDILNLILASSSAFILGLVLKKTYQDRSIILSSNISLGDSSFDQCGIFSNRLINSPLSWDDKIKTIYESRIALNKSDVDELEKINSSLINDNIKIYSYLISKGSLIEFIKKTPKIQFLYKDILALNKYSMNDIIRIYCCGNYIGISENPLVPNTKFLKNTILQDTSACAIKSNNLPINGLPEELNLMRVFGKVFPLILDKEKYIESLNPQKDHRFIGKKQNLYMFSTTSPGSPFFLPHGVRIFQKLVDFLRDECQKQGFEEVLTPTIFKKTLWETSGHWENYRDDMFSISNCCNQEDEFSIKPMNCPAHCVIFSDKFRSYKELPLKLMEFSPLHRNEASGALGGLTRVRKFHQDDGHIFCAPDQISKEIVKTLDMMDYVYKKLGFDDYSLSLSTRPEGKYLGTLEEWDNSEKQLVSALNSANKKWSLKEGDGAFYGPKIDVHIKDSRNRSHQSATIQLDFQLPLRFKLSYTNDQGQIKTPVMIHRAILGSFERIIAILAEHYSGNWPFWLSPRQAIIIPVTESNLNYASSVRDEILKIDSTVDGIRKNMLHIDIENTSESLATHIRNSQHLGYNYILVVGRKEENNLTVNLRDRNGVILGEFTVPEIKKMFIETYKSFK